MAEMAGFDPRRGWDRLYSMFGPVGEPGPEARAIVTVLRDLAGGGPALELAVGDGRIAIPLAATGIEVDGIDISPSGIDQIKAHPQGGAVNASVADIRARNAGLKRREVWGGWTREPYGADSPMLLATYEAA